MTYPEDQTNEDIAHELEAFDEEFRDAKPDTQERSEVPDGTYQVNIENLAIRKSKTDGKTLVKWMLRVISGPQKKRVIWRNNSIATPDNRKFLKGDLLAAGLNLEKLSDLPARLHELLDMKLEVKKVTTTKAGKVYSNVYIQKRIDVTVPAEKNDEEVPF
jgi:hypothetical protein